MENSPVFVVIPAYNENAILRSAALDFRPPGVSLSQSISSRDNILAGLPLYVRTRDLGRHLTEPARTISIRNAQSAGGA